MAEIPNNTHPHQHGHNQQAHDSDKLVRREPIADVPHQHDHAPSQAHEHSARVPSIANTSSTAHDHDGEEGAMRMASGHGGHGDQHGGGRHVDHTGHELLFRNRFWVCLLLTIPVLLYSPMIQMFFGFQVPSFAGSQWTGPFFAFVIFVYGGVPFLQMALPEVRNRQPGMMTLISLAISVAFVYSIDIWFSRCADNF
jgi:Cu2+-exporting ATPase